MRLADVFRRRLAASPRFGTVSESPLPITCFTYSEEARAQRRKIPLEELTLFEQRMNLLLAEEIVRRGWAWISSTRLRPTGSGGQARLRGVTVMRMMVINYETRERHLRRLVADLERLAGEPGLRRRARRQMV
jgi:glutamate/tyrosine decarboxylase-like PLP-dependent enzyme